MTYGGWITFLTSTLGFTLLFAWCIYKVLTSKNPHKVHGIENTEEMEHDIPVSQPAYSEKTTRKKK